jgi:hypothetical protein
VEILLLAVACAVTRIVGKPAHALIVLDQQDLKTAGTHKLLEIWQAAVFAAAAVAVVVVAVVAVVGPLDCTSHFGEGLCVVSAAAAGSSVASLAVQMEILALESSSLMVKSLTPYPSCFQLVHVLALKKTSSLILQGLQHSWHSYPACEGLGAAVVALSDAADAADAGGVHLSTAMHWDSLQDYVRQCSHSSSAAHWVASTHYYSLH